MEGRRGLPALDDMRSTTVRTERYGMWKAFVAMAAGLAGCAEGGSDGEPRPSGASVGMPELDVTVAPLALANCSFNAGAGQLTWTVPAGATAVVTQNAASKAILVNGVTCAATTVKTLRLTVGANANISVDYGAALYLLGTGSTRTGVESVAGLGVTA